MALVQVDLSEYDMLREMKNKAEKELEEVKEQLKSLKDNSSCVVKTRYYMPRLDVQLATKHAVQQILSGYKTRAMNLSPFYYPGRDWQKIRLEDIQSDLEKAISYGFREANKDAIHNLYNPKSNYVEDGVTCEVIGFDSIRAEVQAALKDEYEFAITQKKNELEFKINDYNKKLASVRKEMEKEYQARIDKLEKDLVTTETTYDKKIKKLEAQLKEARKSQEEKVAEAEEKVRLALQELEAVRGKQAEQPKKKGLFGLF